MKSRGKEDEVMPVVRTNKTLKAQHAKQDVRAKTRRASGSNFNYPWIGSSSARRYMSRR
jgi:hypothetical protein